MEKILVGKCICQGSLVYGVKHSRLNFYFLLLTTNRLEELAATLVKDMEKCPLHFQQNAMIPDEIKKQYESTLSSS